MSDQASYRNSFQEFLKHINLQSPGIQSIGLCERFKATYRDK